MSLWNIHRPTHTHTSVYCLINSRCSTIIWLFVECVNGTLSWDTPLIPTQINTNPSPGFENNFFNILENAICLCTRCLWKCTLIYLNRIPCKQSEGCLELVNCSSLQFVKWWWRWCHSIMLYLLLLHYSP